ncbi:MAG: hypothetical protein CMC95_06045 [Flavobacteriales bacterium]|nr:hypothetical protein [Flavobacteriales bacterium]|tara:strand:+ start:4291 stop:4788 length:498 start_codon:yes stop_codon:yes gene_type:complete
MTYFKEEQYFRQKLLWLVLLFFPAFSLYGLYQQVMMGNAIGDNPLSDEGLISFSLIVGLGLPVIFWFMKLKLRVSKEGLHYQFFPVHFKERLIPFEDITNFKARTYSPLKEFGGWGIRFGFESKAYNVSGDKGLQLELSNGRKVLFGSQNHKALEKAMKKAQNAS